MGKTRSKFSISQANRTAVERKRMTEVRVNYFTKIQPGCTSNCTPLIVAGTDDDLWQSYLSVKTQAAADFVESYLWDHSAPGAAYNGTTVQSRGL